MSSTNKKKDNTQAAEKVPRLIYCGPNMPGGLLRQHAIYKGGIPPYADDIITRCPAIKDLIVPVDDLAKTRIDVGIKGTPLNEAYEEVQQYFAGGGK